MANEARNVALRANEGTAAPSASRRDRSVNPGAATQKIATRYIVGNCTISMIAELNNITARKLRQHVKRHLKVVATMPDDVVVSEELHARISQVLSEALAQIHRSPMDALKRWISTKGQPFVTSDDAESPGFTLYFWSVTITVWSNDVAQQLLQLAQLADANRAGRYCPVFIEGFHSPEWAHFFAACLGVGKDEVHRCRPGEFLLGKHGKISRSCSLQTPTPADSIHEPHQQSRQVQELSLDIFFDPNTPFGASAAQLCDWLRDPHTPKVLTASSIGTSQILNWLRFYSAPVTLLKQQPLEFSEFSRELIPLLEDICRTSAYALGNKEIKLEHNLSELPALGKLLVGRSMQQLANIVLNSTLQQQTNPRPLTTKDLAAAAAALFSQDSSIDRPSSIPSSVASDWTVVVQRWDVKKRLVFLVCFVYQLVAPRLERCDRKFMRKIVDSVFVVPEKPATHTTENQWDRWFDSAQKLVTSVVKPMSAVQKAASLETFGVQGLQHIVGSHVGQRAVHNYLDGLDWPLIVKVFQARLTPSSCQ
jgi:hypothetical protein